jgi:hypothetical protein
MNRDEVIDIVSSNINYNKKSGDNTFINGNYYSNDFIELKVDYKDNIKLVIFKIVNTNEYSYLDLEETFDLLYYEVLFNLYKEGKHNDDFEVAMEFNWKYKELSEWFDDRYYYIITTNMIRKSIMERKLGKFNYHYLEGGKVDEYYKRILYEYR